MHRSAMAMLLVALVATLGACTEQSVPRIAYSDDGQYLRPAAGPGLVAKDTSPIPDVPLPIGFVGVPSRSQADFDGQVRHVHHVYQGRANTAEVVNFYRRQLPRKDWASLGREQEDDGTTVMRFTKGHESLNIRVGVRHSVVTVIVNIGPRN
ncbi:hypothetical protein ACERK3_00260 [Phycisphaerales bacterium AB-hyl4]|uniref:Lipoprotein n=1 Tax=Natronomicrosphaera hydrolytica TaxID=3242702 RepID=A0ABV4TZF2_9BACT